MEIKTQTLITIILFIKFSVITSQKEDVLCSNGGNYTTTDPYAADLTALLASLSSNISGGFSATSLGEASAIAMCISGIAPEACSKCVNDLSESIRQSCPNQLEATMWSEFCMVRYSNLPIFGTLVNSPVLIWSNTVNVSDPREFGKVREILIDELEGEAAHGGDLQKAAVGNMSTPDNQTIYGLVQCTPDLSPYDCASCLNDAAGYIPLCCGIPVGITVNLPSCILRYEVYQFYHTEPQPPSPSPSPAPAWISGNCDYYRNRRIMISVVTVAALVAVSCVGVFVGRRIKHMNKGDSQSEEGLVAISSVESIQYDFCKIRVATNDFSDANKLGRGGFGTVYKGELETGRKIAVKRLSRDSGQGDIEFKNEVLLLARLQHRNLVRLLGFSIKEMERLLVYEFVQNGSLDRYIFGDMKSDNLEWEKRFKIITGIARGILYLHEDSRLRIVHRDLKPSNVLLDEEMNPKIADFGLAKLVVPDSNEVISSRIVGTYGYMAPEYAIQGQFSIKIDVYSFGMLVLEIVSGQRNTFLQNDESSGDAWRSLRDERGENMIDPVLMVDDSCNRKEMLRCIHIALLCVQKSPDDRPTMADVVLMLNNRSLPSQLGL